ncbi:MAG: hypothetical protein WC907_07610 [Acholeplasmataceae bacterium]|jgi:hypothetical protein
MKIFFLNNPICYGVFKSRKKSLKNGIITNIAYFEEDTYAEQLYKQFKESVKNYKFIKQEENKMKQTVIKYTEIGDRTTIVSIENVASYAEIARHYGNVVAEIYKNGTLFYIQTNTPSPTSLFLRDRYFTYNLYEGQILASKTFIDITEILKAAGERLREIIKENKPEVKVVRI